MATLETTWRNRLLSCLPAVSRADDYAGDRVPSASRPSSARRRTALPSGQHPRPGPAPRAPCGVTAGRRGPLGPRRGRRARDRMHGQPAGAGTGGDRLTGPHGRSGPPAPRPPLAPQNRAMSAAPSRTGLMHKRAGTAFAAPGPDITRSGGTRANEHAAPAVVGRDGSGRRAPRPGTRGRAASPGAA